MKKRVEKAFDSAAAAAKQVITLSTAVVALTVTFLTDLLPEASVDSVTLRVAWLLYVLAILFGLWVLLSITGALGDEEHISDEKLSVYRKNIQIPMLLQLMTFLLAIAFTVAFGWTHF